MGGKELNCAQHSPLIRLTNLIFWVAHLTTKNYVTFFYCQRNGCNYSFNNFSITHQHQSINSLSLIELAPHQCLLELLRIKGAVELRAGRRVVRDIWLRRSSVPGVALTVVTSVLFGVAIAVGSLWAVVPGLLLGVVLEGLSEDFLQLILFACHVVPLTT